LDRVRVHGLDVPHDGARIAYSIFPDIVIGKMNIWESAASTASLAVCAHWHRTGGTHDPFYTIFIYKIFYGKSQPLSYE